MHVSQRAYSETYHSITRGGWYPWGWRFDASLCNLRESRKERGTAIAIDEFPTGVSVYGVRGLGGNVENGTSTELVQGTGPGRRVSRVSRGGSWGVLALVLETSPLG